MLKNTDEYFLCIPYVGILELVVVRPTSQVCFSPFGILALLVNLFHFPPIFGCLAYCICFLQKNI